MVYRSYLMNRVADLLQRKPHVWIVSRFGRVARSRICFFSLDGNMRGENTTSAIHVGVTG